MTEKKSAQTATTVLDTKNMSSRTQDDYTPNSSENQAFSFPKTFHADFAMIYEGYSMEPTIMDGDIVAIRRQPTVENEDIAAVRIGDKTLITYVYQMSDSLILIPRNERFLQTALFGEEIAKAEIIGKVVGAWRRFDHPKTPFAAEETSG